jgi:hypothetical protein
VGGATVGVGGTGVFVGVGGTGVFVGVGGTGVGVSVGGMGDGVSVAVGGTGVGVSVGGMGDGVSVGAWVRVGRGVSVGIGVAVSVGSAAVGVSGIDVAAATTVAGTSVDSEVLQAVTITNTSTRATIQAAHLWPALSNLLHRSTRSCFCHSLLICHLLRSRHACITPGAYAGLNQVYH